MYTIRSCFYIGELSSSLCCKNLHNVTGKFQRMQLQLPFNLKTSFKTSNTSRSRWPGKSHTLSTPESHIQDNYSLSRLWKPFVFTMSVSGVSMAGAAIWQYETVRSQAERAKHWWHSPNTPKYGSFRQHMNAYWKRLTVADKTFLPLLGLNALVFFAWKIPKWHPIMTTYFTSGLASRTLCWPMLLSAFSHYSFFHLAANMFVLHSFSEKAVSIMGKEQFVGLYLSACVVSSFTSYLYKAIIRSPTSSLGASGAVMFVLAYVCSKYPHSKLAIIFLPQFPFEAGTGLKSLLCIDTLGCLLRWSIFDHAAHLGGNLFGIFWFCCGHEYIWRKRGPLVSAWHNMRGAVE